MTAGRVAEAVAGAIVRREPVDWDAAARRSPKDRPLVGALHGLASLCDHPPELPVARGWFPGLRAMPLWLTPVVALATLVVGSTIAAYAFALATGQALVPGPTAVQTPALAVGMVLSFSGAALFLAVVGREERTALYLAICLLTACAFTAPMLRRLPPEGLPGLIAHLWVGVYPDVFLPAVAWAFARRLPDAVRASRLDDWLATCRALTLGLGAIAGVVNLVIERQLVAVDAPALTAWWVRGLLHAAVRSDPDGLFWPLFYACLLPPLLVIAVRTHRAPPAARHRAHAFAAALAFGAIPIAIVELLRAFSPAWRLAVIEATLPARIADAIVMTSLLAVPPLTTAAIVVRRALPLRHVVGRGLRTLVERHALTASTLAVSAWLLALAARGRERTLVALAADASVRAAVVAAMLVALAWLARDALRSTIDRALLGVPVNHDRALARALLRLGDQTGALAAAWLLREIDALFRPVALALLDPAPVRPEPAASPAGAVVGRLVSPLERGTSLAWMAARAHEPVHLPPTAPLFDLVPRAEQEWLLRTGVVVLLTPSGAPAGRLLAVGHRGDGLPYDGRDLTLLAGLASAAGPRLPEPRPVPISGDAAAAAGVAGPAALECPVCGLVGDALPLGCACPDIPVRAHVPALVAGKYQVERRLGRGGMGVAYLARDRVIGRPVAVKAIPTPNADAGALVLREAQAMAAVTHPHLATIYTVEQTDGGPVIVMEYLDGILADRLRTGPLPLATALALGRDIASALAALHAAGIPHRDVKPGNIGFARDGSPRLLDFGLAALHVTPEALADRPAPEPIDGPGSAEPPSVWPGATSVAMAGTLLYLPPEALDGAPPGTGRDLWALGLVVWEAIAGVHPFRAATAAGTIRRIQRGDALRDPRHARRLPDDVLALLRTLLAPRVDDRPASAADVSRAFARLTALHTTAPAGPV